MRTMRAQGFCGSAWTASVWRARHEWVLMAVLRTQIAMACMILGIIFFGILLGSIAEALQVWSPSCFTASLWECHMQKSRP